ncbi:gamma-glutamylaminecyclotransferase-like [Sphaeramia orbicularis]|uniref:Gamma-glutamylaminecyclotransferase n=1 Tax=Sphaeramia orbicularis TaxID=375764 RepID=A0A673C5K7_9TELE|nr:gamma-glutamylaminecyclotransferase-like [Sphaeramia orbicularis]
MRVTVIPAALYPRHFPVGYNRIFKYPIVDIFSFFSGAAEFTSPDQMTCVFVYGTLKKGQPNYYRMFDTTNGKAEFLASARTTERYPLVIATKYNIPFLLNIPGQGNQVHGEIYKVDEQMLKFLDDFEGVPEMYQRTLVKLEVKEWVGPAEGETPTPGSITEAFIYSTTTYDSDCLSLPMYENYDSYGKHGLEYDLKEIEDR